MLFKNCFIYKVWHLAFYCQTQTFLAADFLLIQTGLCNAGKRLIWKASLKKREPWMGDPECPSEVNRLSLICLHFKSKLHGSPTVSEKAKVMFGYAPTMLVKQVNGLPPLRCPLRWCDIGLSRESRDVRTYMPLTRVRSDLNIPSAHSKWAPWNCPFSISGFQTAIVNPGVTEPSTVGSLSVSSTWWLCGGRPQGSRAPSSPVLMLFLHDLVFKAFSVGKPMKLPLPSASRNVLAISLSGRKVFGLKRKALHLSSFSSKFWPSCVDWESRLSSLNLLFSSAPEKTTASTTSTTTDDQMQTIHGEHLAWGLAQSIYKIISPVFNPIFLPCIGCNRV